MKMRWNVLVNNGYRHEHQFEVHADTVKKARELAAERLGGWIDLMGRARAFKVQRAYRQECDA